MATTISLPRAQPAANLASLARELTQRRGPLTIAILAIVPVVLWVAARPLDERFVTPFMTLRSLAIAAALAGVAAFALNLILAGRFKPVATLFGGLDKMYGVHRQTGKIAFALVVSHAVMMTAGYATLSWQSALQLYIPGANWTITAGVVALAGMAAAVWVAISGRFQHETFVKIHRSFGLLFVIASYHVWMTPGAKAETPALAVYLGVLSTLGVLAFTYRSLLHRFLVPRFDYDVVAVNRLNQVVTEIVMRPQGKAMKFEPGQFVFISFTAPGVPREYHPFSITSARDDRQIRLVVKALGDYTRLLTSQLQPGAFAKIEGPFGSLVYTSIPNHRQVWIAGGIGVTPFLSMARSLSETARYEIDFYYATDSVEDAHFVDELYALSDRNPRLRVIPIRKDQLGHVSAADIQGASLDLPSKDILICGPPMMQKILKKQFTSLGVPPRQIHFENFVLR